MKSIILASTGAINYAILLYCTDLTKTVSILQSNYIPWKGYFDIIAKSDVFVIYDEVQFTKNDWRNRNLIKTPTGKQWITIPVNQKSLDQKIYETEISQFTWSKKHLGMLQANYAKAPHFKSLRDRIFDLYNTSETNLSRINLSFIQGICDILEIKTQIIDSRSLDLQGDRVERLLHACRKLGAETYLSGPAARNYLNEAIFADSGISVEWMDYTGYNEYDQLYPPFEHSVSVLDLLFNAGDEARKYLKY